MKLQVKDIIKETKDTVSVCFKNGSIFKKIAYKPGQFITLHVPIDNVVHKRAYSFSSSPFLDKDLKVTIKRVAQGLVSNFVHDKLKIGDKITIDSPSGSFYIEPKKNIEKNYTFFAGGSGITPIFSIIQSILVNEPKSKILLIYANQDHESIIFYKAITSLTKQYLGVFAVEHILSRNKEWNSNYHTGLLDETLLLKLFDKHTVVFEEQYYMICGPFGFMEKVKSILRENNVPQNLIKVEVFKSPKIKLKGKDLLSDVEIQYKGETHKIKVPGNKSILQAAMNNNVVLPYSCRAGMCVSCKASCISGEVDMTDGHCLDEEDVAAGKVLTCISFPSSKKVVIAY